MLIELHSFHHDPKNFMRIYILFLGMSNEDIHGHWRLRIIVIQLNILSSTHVVQIA